VPLLASCGEQRGDSGATHGSGIAGRVHVGPQCPVQTKEHPCADKAAAGVRVTVAKQVTGGSETDGETVASTTTNGDGTYRVTLSPGSYVVTSDAGMSCQPMVARVIAGGYARLDIRCDTGIR
jgi:Carboxypeptidase regulatory-like domain